MTGRITDIIARWTSKITPGGVESARQHHPAVVIAAVIAATDPEEGQVPVAFVVPRPGAAIIGRELLEFLRTRIAAYEVPCASTCGPTWR